MSSDNSDKLVAAVRAYEHELASCKLKDLPLDQIVSASILAEKVIKSYFPLGPFYDKEGKLREPTLGECIYPRLEFLGETLGNEAKKAVWIRNRSTHDHKDGPASDEEMAEAAGVLAKVIEKHLKTVRSQVSGSDSLNRLGSLENGEADGLPTTAGSRDRIPEPENARVAVEITTPKFPPLEAPPDAPLLSATSLAEYAFCPRAGVLTHEGRCADPDDELPSLSLLPWFEEHRIKEDYAASSLKLFWILTGFIVGLIILAVLPIGAALYHLFLLGGVGLGGYLAALEYGIWKELGRRRLAAKIEPRCDPEPNNQIQQPVNWWGLLKAGYGVRRPAAALRNSKWKISGKPRRVLQKGDWSIPVHRVNRTNGKVEPQHIVRIMVHCLLLESVEYANSPFGILLFGDTYEGFTIPRTEANQELCYKTIMKAREAIAKAREGEQQPPAPVKTTACSGCHHGSPRHAAKEVKTMHYGDALSPFVLLDRKNTMFHCNCGDRFRWKPPHNGNERLNRID